MARRSAEILQPDFRPWLYVAGAGALVLFAALVALVVQLVVSIRARDATCVFAGDPWDGRGLEWATSSPPPDYNFAVIPEVDARDAFYAGKRHGGWYAHRTPYTAIEMPRGSMTGPLIGLAATATSFGLIWHMWWLAALSLETLILVVVVRSFVRGTHRVVPAREVAAIEHRWHAARAAATPTPRALELTTANSGRADIPA